MLHSLMVEMPPFAILAAGILLYQNWSCRSAFLIAFVRESYWMFQPERTSFRKVSSSSSSSVLTFQVHQQKAFQWLNHTVIQRYEPSLLILPLVSIDVLNMRLLWHFPRVLQTCAIVGSPKSCENRFC